MMLIPAALRIFLSREPADMRRSFTGLCGMVRDGLHADRLSGHLYCFRNKRGDKPKASIPSRWKDLPPLQPASQPKTTATVGTG